MVDRWRSDQLTAGVPPGRSLLLRSASSLTPYIVDTTGRWRASAISPEVLAVVNSAIPFSQNYGSLWAGRGASTRTLVGFKLESARVRFIFAPEIIYSANTDWLLRHDYYAPELPPDRSPYTLPYYVGAFTIDQPMRFGDSRIRRIDLGQTTAMWSGNRFAFGFSNENEWWGPGIRNAIVLSNNAPGFPHLFFRTARPLKTYFGDLELRWLVGGLTESSFFDTVSTNDARSIAAIGATVQTRWDPDLTFGFARSVYATSTGWSEVPWRWLDVFARTYQDVPDTTRTRRDQLFTLFARWVFPSEGLEVYGEWGRRELLVNLRDFLLAPNHTQAYTIGMQWRGPEWRAGTFRVQSEITQLEQSATFRDRPVGSWYTSTRVIQGYTHRGEIIGASIGPGASSQWLAVDYLRQSWRVGAFGGRIRWNQDVHNNYGAPVYVAYCNQDVSIYPGIRAAKSSWFGTLTADLTFQNRLTPFFQHGGGCPNNGRRLDIRNNTLSVTVSPWNRR
ncbi:MAG: capsule assembly Wzi family protein [Gemmatimonadaceae bacterium]